MGISSYEKNGKTLWKVYVNIRSKSDPTAREQRVVSDIETEKAALAEEKKLVREATEKLTRRTSQGLTWDAVIAKWEMTLRNNPSVYQIQPDTIFDNVNILRRSTKHWLDRPAAEITIGEGRAVFNQLEAEGRTQKYIKKIKSAINVVYKWGIENRLIIGVHQTPVQGLSIKKTVNEKVPDILTIEEIRSLLFLAKQLSHPWYPIWAMALLTGMRNGELHALLWTDIDLENRKLTVSKSFHSKRRVVKSTKSGAWRTVPISDDLFNLLSELKNQTGRQDQVLPRFSMWDSGRQSEVLRTFCEGIKIRPVCFHALRACFATQLLSNDIAPARIMKICGWTNLKTMQHYVRLAGVDERGATDALRVLPDDAAVLGEVVNLFGMNSKR